MQLQGEVRSTSSGVLPDVVEAVVSTGCRLERQQVRHCESTPAEKTNSAELATGTERTVQQL